MPASGERDAVAQAGNEFADKATTVNEAMKTPLVGWRTITTGF